jgi:hypothetical protein
VDLGAQIRDRLKVTKRIASQYTISLPLPYDVDRCGVSECILSQQAALLTCRILAARRDLSALRPETFLYAAGDA